MPWGAVDAKEVVPKGMNPSAFLQECCKQL